MAFAVFSIVVKDFSGSTLQRKQVQKLIHSYIIRVPCESRKTRGRDFPGTQLRQIKQEKKLTI